jgi:hypothetical protein
VSTLVSCTACCHLTPVSTVCVCDYLCRRCLCPCRQERAALAAASDDEGPEGGSEEAELLRHEGLDLHHDMLQESRGVEEYERLNRISGGSSNVFHASQQQPSAPA